MNDKVSVIKVIKFSGAFIAYMIGAGFATGQEILQFFTSYGYMGLGTIIVGLIIMAWFSGTIMSKGYEKREERNVDLYKYYCGNAIGSFFKWFVIVFLYMIVIIMISGAGTTINEYYGLPKLFGNSLMTVVILATILIGSDKLLNIMGAIGPVIIVFAFVIAIASISRNFSGFSDVTQYLAENPIPQPASSWWMSALLYASFVCFAAVMFLTDVATKAQSKREAILGGALGAVAYMLGCLVMDLGLLANLKDIASKGVPNLYLAQQLSPIFGILFSVVLLCGIYTTATPMLWTVINRFSREGTNQYKILTISLAMVAFIGGFLPFGKLVGTVYPFVGYMGLVLFAGMIIKPLTMKKNDEIVTENTKINV